MNGAVVDLKSERLDLGAAPPRPAGARLVEGADVFSVASAWDALRLRLGSRHVRHHPAWLRIQAETGGGSGDPRFAKRGSEPMLATLHEGATLAGVAPFLVHHWRWRAKLGYRSVAEFPVRRAVLCGDELLSAPDVGSHEALLEATLGAPGAYHLIFVESLRVGGPLWRAIHESARIREHFWVEIPRAPTQHRLIRMAASFEDYLAKFSGRTRRTLAYKVRKLEERAGAPITLQRIRRRDELGGFLEMAERISARSWQGTKLGQVFRPEVQAARLGAFADLGWGRSYLLRCGSEPVAFVAGTQAAGVFYYDHASYDPRWAAHHPGTVLLYKLIEDLYADDTPEVLDFGCGDNEYKRVFANESYEEVTALLVRKSAYTALALATNRACVKTSAAARAGLDRLKLREKVRHLLRGRPNKPGGRSAHDDDAAA